jgi:hypothetical protein
MWREGMNCMLVRMLRYVLGYEIPGRMIGADIEDRIS